MENATNNINNEKDINTNSEIIYSSEKVDLNKRDTGSILEFLASFYPKKSKKDTLKEYQTFVKEFEVLGDVSGISIHTKTSDIYVKKGKTFNVRYTGRFKGEYAPILRREVIANGLSVTADESPEDLTLQFSAVEITIPDKIQTVLIDTKSGNIKIEDVKVEGIDMVTISGDISTFSISKNINAKTTSGDIIIESTAEKITADSVSGDVDITPMSLENSVINAKTTSGDIDVYPSLNEVGYKNIKCNIKVSSGDVENKSKIIDDGLSIVLNLSTVSGDILID